jgi:hypothetical protein
MKIAEMMAEEGKKRILERIQIRIHFIKEKK